MIPERIPIESEKRQNPFLKASSQSDWGISSGGDEVRNWVVEHLSPSELGEKYIVVLQSHTHLHLASNKSGSLPAETNCGPNSNLEKEFNERADRWERQTGIYSSPTKRFLHEDYQIIMTMGEPVVPLILRRLRTKPSDWFWALKHFARKDVAAGCDNFQDAVRAWLEWGKEKYKL